MRFQLLDDVFEPEIVDESVLPSRSTGRHVRRLTIRFRTRGPAARERVDTAGSRSSLVSIDEKPPTQWRRVGPSSSMNDGHNTTWVHTWELEEMEPLNVKELHVNGLRLAPSRYAERWRGDYLEAHALVTVGKTDHQELIQLASAFDPVSVVRLGLSAEPRTMEIQQGPWAERDGHFRWLLRLEDVREPDRGPNAGLLVMGRTHHSVPYLLALVEDMADLLVSKGVIDQGDFSKVKDRALQRRGERAVEMLKVDDIDEYWDEEAFTR